MKRLMFVCLIASMVAITADPLAAGGLRCRNNNDCAPADCNVTWVDKEVTCYRVEMKTKVVPTVVNRVVSKCVAEEYKYVVMVPETTQEKRQITVNRCVTKEVPYTYNVCVPVTTQEKRTITVNRCVAKEVPCTYNVCVPVTTQEKRTITVNRCVAKEVPYTYTVCVPVTTQEKRQVTSYKCVPETVMQKCTVKKWDASCCKWVCQEQEVAVTVNRKVAVTSEVLVNVCKYEHQQKQGTRTVTEMVPETREVLVNVCRYETRQQQGTRCVVEMVPETREVLVNVTTCKPVEKVGTRNRIVCETVQETVNVNQCYAETVPYKKIVKVAVCTPCAAPAPVVCK